MRGAGDGILFPWSGGNVMTVFKGYMRIMKKTTGLILLYLGIFYGVTMALQAAAGKETYTSYESEKIKDRSGG